MDFWLQNNVEYHDKTNSKHSAETNYSAPEEKLQERQDLREAVREKEG